MAKISIIIDTRRPNAVGRFPIKFRIVHGSTNTTIGTGIHIEQRYFVGDAEHIVSPNCPNAKNINSDLRSLFYKYQSSISELENNTQLATISASAIKDHIKNNNPTPIETTFSSEIDKYISNCRKPKTAHGYAYARDLLYRYIGKQNIHFEEINYTFIKGFNRWLEQQGLGINSRSVVMRNIRAVFNEAIKSDLIDIRLYPFRNFTIERVKKEKEYLSDEQLTALLTADIKQSSYARARDIFMLSFYLCGINPIDLYQLPKSNGLISFIREKIAHKEPDNVRISIQPEAQRIIDKYKGAEHLLYFADNSTSYSVFKRNTTRDLSLLGNRLGMHLYFYLARYTWSTIASRIGVPHEVIDKALGHIDTSVLDKYVSFDWNRVDAANRQVIDYVNNLTQSNPL